MSRPGCASAASLPRRSRARGAAYCRGAGARSGWRSTSVGHDAPRRGPEATCGGDAVARSLGSTGLAVRRAQGPVGRVPRPPGRRPRRRARPCSSQSRGRGGRARPAPHGLAHYRGRSVVDLRPRARAASARRSSDCSWSSDPAPRSRSATTRATPTRSRSCAPRDARRRCDGAGGRASTGPRGVPARVRAASDVRARVAARRGPVPVGRWRAPLAREASTTIARTGPGRHRRGSGRVDRPRRVLDDARGAAPGNEPEHDRQQRSRRASPPHSSAPWRSAGASVAGSRMNM